MSGVFISGTDTGCGKTRVGAALARAAVEAGQRVRILKPVETGCELKGGELLPADAVALARAAQDRRPTSELCPYRLALPAAPEAAARAEGVHIEPKRIEEAYRRAASEADLVLVEGPGGLRVPLCPELDMAGLAGLLDLPILLVARAALGTLNHTRLSLEAARTRGLRVLGVVVSYTSPDLAAAEQDNLALMLERLPVPWLGSLPHGAERLDVAGAAALRDTLAPS